ncbi:MAG: CpsB/CapC family capsule biosynthesis tyrosine phosphatase [Candidatus Aminicenantales bacterium]
MIDLHTHLLPDWDDGAKDWEETLAMTKAAEEDGIKKICLTPHLFRLTKHGSDLGLFEQRMAEFMLWADRLPIAFFRGAEVYIDDQIVENIKKNNLTVNNSSYVFVEFPADGMIAGVRDVFYRIMLEGHIPIISHPERNSIFAGRPELLFDLVSLGALAQVTAMSILGEFGSEARKSAEVFLRHNLVQLIASDAHNLENRPPLLRKAVERAKKIVGEEKALAMVTKIPQAILDNRAIPNCGDPVHPHKKGWRFPF